MPISEYDAAVARSSTTSDVFNAIGEVHRREILDTLIGGEKAVGAIVNDLSLSQPQVSKHLRVLSEVGLVNCRAEGRRRLYSLEPAACSRFTTGWQLRAGVERPTGSGGRLPQRATTTRRAAVTPNWHGSSVIEFPNDLEIVTTREFDAPLELVFDVLTKPEHVSKWFAPFACEVTECSIDLRVGGNYHIVFVTEDGTECSFRGTYLEVEPPTRTVATWLFEGWPDADAVRVRGSVRNGGSDEADDEASVPRPGWP